MSATKVDWRESVPKRNRSMNALDYEEYLMEKAVETAGKGANPGTAVQQYIDHASLAGKTTNNVAFEVIQSFSGEETKQLTKEKVSKLGVDLATEYSKGRDFVVFTHNDNGLLHNHILIDPVHPKTEKRIDNSKFREWRKVLAINDRIMKKNGLSVIETGHKKREYNLSKGAQQIVRRGGESYELDLMQKADFARAFSTSFDEYAAILNDLKIKTVIEMTNITYHYPDRKGRRGKKLGSVYDKKGLIEAFKANDEKFAKSPQLRRQIHDEIKSIVDPKGNIVGTPSDLLSQSGVSKSIREKDYNKFTKYSHRNDRFSHLSRLDVDGMFFPLSELKKSASQDLLDYCKNNRIKTVTNDKGQTVLKGREYVALTSSGFENSRNGTVGSLVDFVAVYKKTDYLGAIAQISGNEKVKLLSEFYERGNLKFAPFYVPKQNQNSPKIPGGGFRKKGGEDDYERMSNFIQKNHQGAGKMFALEKDKEPQGEPFYFEKGKSRNLRVYASFDAFLKSGTGIPKSGQPQKDSILALSSKDLLPLDMILGSNSSISTVSIVGLENGNPRNGDLIDRIGKRYQKLGIEIHVETPRNRGKDFKGGLEI